jgi:hypothetical protein
MEKLSYLNIASNLFNLFIQTRKVLFSGKFYYFVGLVILWVAFFIVIFHFVDDSGIFSQAEIFYVLNFVPMLVMAIYVSMTLVTFEKDNFTIETMFSVPGSPYKVWSYKLVVMYIILIFLQMTLILMSYLFIADFQISVMFLHAFVPIFFIANLNFYFSTVLKSGIAAGLVTLIVLFFFFLIGVDNDDWVWFLYLSPYNKPFDLDIMIWNERLLYNKIGVASLGIVFMYRGLSRLRNREPFIK